MAEKQTAIPVKAEPVKAERIQVLLPKGGAQEQNYTLVGVNGKFTQIPRGQPVMVTREVYEILSRSENAKIISDAYDEAHTI